MSKLFIIGNGFDLAHGLPTAYQDFHRYLSNLYTEAETQQQIIPEPHKTPRGEWVYEMDQIVGFLMTLIANSQRAGNNWSDLEEALGHLDFSYCFDWFEKPLEKNGAVDRKKLVQINKDISADLEGPTLKILDFFSSWIDSIKIDKDIVAKKDFQKLINLSEDLFLTFNYTNTLEKVYGVSRNVWHIHGKQGEKLIFGHGNSQGYNDACIHENIGAEHALNYIRKSLKKDCQSACMRNKDFFDVLKMHPVNKIYSYGFSFSDVDKIYLRKIFNCIVIDVPLGQLTWYFNDYDKNNFEGYKKILINCGFDGQFATFHIAEDFNQANFEKSE
ncbi:bacteriophage abortive infection AbiH family protein [Sporolactobacillus spathodeae]|uniref:Bacteriophage abortive infection AbiH n=1 Tax=Sporolactobacillus spathodeae TaxID=1465502 RepID=A0ABS2Q5L2_9BACL|nr:bacteriophage abortive infection AbiH family protein [Sporolactobacillus spathodeae]MBM7657068.1 hypothetical protein [Sporolactobacillus spathodeae]